MTFQDIVDAVNAATQEQRADYHVTLGELIETLEELDEDLPVKFSDGKYPGDLRSYRGYYSDMMMEPTDEKITTSELLPKLKNALGTDFTGYKGGEFTMGERTPLWQAEWGSLGPPVMSAEENEDQITLVLGERK